VRILLSNDDGIFAPGLAALYAAVADLGQVTVVAPESPQSAAGHSITIHQPLVVQRVHIDSPIRFGGISVSGRPADCVRLAIRALLKQPPELVLTGVNAGANVGINVLYSGTVAAAAEAAICGIPAVAFSAELTDGEVDYARIARLCRWVLDRLLVHGLGPGDLVNVNIPDLRRGWPRGVRVVPQSTVELEDIYHLQGDAAGREVYRLGDQYDFAPGQDHADVPSLAEGYITVTPLHVDMTDRRRLETFRRHEWGDVPSDGG
jgi:5'-nucleotidase